MAVRVHTCALVFVFVDYIVVKVVFVLIVCACVSAFCIDLYIYIYIHIGVRDLPLRDMISLGAWRMGLGCPGKTLPSSPPPPSPPPTRVWKNFSSFITESDLPECADRSV